MNRLNASRVVSLALVALILSLQPPGGVSRASELLRPFLEEKAKVIHQDLADRGFPSVALGYIVGSDPRIGSALSPGLTEMLARALANAGVATSEDASHRLEGRYRPIMEKERPNVCVGLRLSLHLVEVAKPDEILTRFEVTIDEHTPEINKAQLDELIDAVKPPVPASRLVVNRIAAPPGSDAKERMVTFEKGANPDRGYTIDLDFLTQTDAQGKPLFSMGIGKGQGSAFQALPITADGLRFNVDVSGANDVVVRLVNHTGEEYAVELSLDGVSMFAFSEKPMRYVLLPPKSQEYPFIDLVGWYRNNRKSWTFRLVDLGSEEAVSKLAQYRVGEIGEITARFSRCSADKLKGFVDERRVFGRGPEISAEYREVVRNVEPSGRSLTIRYRPADAGTEKCSTEHASDPTVAKKR